MENSIKPKVIVICGPTGVGKTSLSLLLAREFNGWIIGADSMQIYKFMNIGTAKPSDEERSRIPHYMIDIVHPDEPYDAARYAREAREAILNICRHGRIPVVVGGTGFYIKALLHGLCEASPADESIRKKLNQQFDIYGKKWLYDRLVDCDPDAAAHIHPNDAYRIIRALEIYETAGIPASEYQRQHGFKDQPFEVLKIGLCLDRQALYDRINARVIQMISQGLLDEVKTLLQMGFTQALKPMQAIGYQHMLDFIHGRMNWEETVSTLMRDTRRYAKRQLTWFKKEREIMWKTPDLQNEIQSMVGLFIGTDH
jgi:tRNA dimethylallyltransferase